MQFIVNQRDEDGAYADSIVEAKSWQDAMELVDGAVGAHPLDELDGEDGPIRFITTVQTKPTPGSGFKSARGKGKCLNGRPCSGGVFHSLIVTAVAPGQVNKRVWGHPELRGRVTWIHRIVEA